jgi:uncharacterized protein
MKNDTRPGKSTRRRNRLTTYNLPLTKIFILPIRLYQLTLSPLLGTHCRHTPSCSQYAIDAIAEWGPVKGMWLGMKRIARCHPWGTSGYDPVPRKNRQA